MEGGGEDDQREKWMDEIHEATGMKLVELKDVTTERKQWRRLVKTVSKRGKTLNFSRGIEVESIKTDKDTFENYIYRIHLTK